MRNQGLGSNAQIIASQQTFNVRAMNREVQRSWSQFDEPEVACLQSTDINVLLSQTNPEMYSEWDMSLFPQLVRLKVRM